MDNKSSDRTNFREDLASAIEKLECFSEQSEEQNEKFKYSFISLAFSEKARERERKRREFNQTEILKAIQTIQKNYLFIQKLKKGNESEQALADSTLKIIQRYNQTVKKASEKQLPLSHRISNFIYKQYGLQVDTDLEKKIIHLPFEATHEFKTSSNHKKINHAAVSFIQQNEQTISNNEADAFRVKAISLLKTNGIRFTTIAEEFQAIRSTPIQATIDSSDLKRIMMTQVLKPFPGEIIAFKGIFQRDGEALHKSVPLTDSFEISTMSHQTGFPHPIQHTGFALADCMVPCCPVNLQKLKSFAPILQLKQEIALKLLPNGSLNSQAKEILKKKREIFEENSKELLQLHLAFYKTLFNAFPEENRSENGLEIIDQFFKDATFDQLSEASEIILQHFIVKPYQLLIDDFINQKNLCYLTSLEILESEQKKPIALLPKSTYEFVSCLGQMIGFCASQIILQHMSETIGFKAPKLKKHEELLQIALYKQLISFHSQVSTIVDKKILLNQLREEILSDIAIFAGNLLTNRVPNKIVQELEVYYQ